MKELKFSNYDNNILAECYLFKRHNKYILCLISLDYNNNYVFKKITGIDLKIINNYIYLDNYYIHQDKFKEKYSEFNYKQFVQYKLCIIYGDNDCIQILLDNN
jgi:hypothetical protein